MIHLFLYYKNLPIEKELSETVFVVENHDSYFVAMYNFKKIYFEKPFDFTNNVNVMNWVKLKFTLKKEDFFHNYFAFDFTNFLTNKNLEYTCSEFEILKISKINFLNEIINYFQNKNNFVIKNSMNLLNDEKLITNLSILNCSFILNTNFTSLIFIYFILTRLKFKILKIVLGTYIFFILLLFNINELLNVSFLRIVFLFFCSIFFNKKHINKKTIFYSTLFFMMPYNFYSENLLYIIIADLFITKINFRFHNHCIKIILFFLLFAPLNSFCDHRINLLSDFFILFYSLVISFSYFLAIFIFYFNFTNEILNYVYQFLSISANFFSNIKSFINLRLSFVFLAIFYIFLYYCLTQNFSKIGNIALRLLFFCFEFLYLLSLLIIPKKDYIEMVNVGNGNMFYMHYQQKNYFIDIGSALFASKEIAGEFAKYNGLNIVESVFITHTDSDHIDNLDSLIKNSIKVKNIVYEVNDYSAKDFNIINFNTTKHDNNNDNSQVIGIQLDGLKILFMGDASKIVERELIQNKNFLKWTEGGIDFFQVGHHGSDTATSDDFVNIIRPKKCFISGEDKGKLHFPKQIVIETLNKYGCQNYIANGINEYSYYFDTQTVVNLNK